MLIILFFSGVFGGSLHLNPVKEYCELPRHVRLGPGGLLFAATPSFLYGWNRAGKLVHRVGGGVVKRVGAYYFDGRHFLICDRQMYPLTSHVFDRDGHHLFSSDFFTFFFRQVGGELFGFPLFETDELPYDPFLFQFHKLQYRVLENRLDWSFGHPVLAKMTRRQQELRANFKRIWVVEVSEIFQVVNELETRVYHYDASARQADINQGSNRPTAAHFTALDLVDFVPLADWPHIPKGIHEPAVMRRWQIQWWYSFSRLSGFYAYGDGFLISYEVPDGPEDGRTGSRLYLQRLSLDFSPVGEPWRGAGMLMGVDGGQAVIFQPNPVLGEDGQPVAMKPTVLFEDLSRP